MKQDKEWKERLWELYGFDNDEISSPNEILFNWGSFLFRKKGTMPFYLATKDSMEDFIQSEKKKSKIEGLEEGFAIGFRNGAGVHSLKVADKTELNEVIKKVVKESI